MLVNVFGDNVFTDDGQAARLSGRVLALISVSEPLFGLSILMQGILEGMGEALTSECAIYFNYALANRYIFLPE